ncbi:uncharacterized protein [Onthophagus taurus]|uniref:uncharacterized protein n=1 Tax=Onthophagus taurus TaxID=166361 RepID=UPI0039BDD0B7
MSYPYSQDVPYSMKKSNGEPRQSSTDRRTCKCSSSRSRSNVGDSKGRRQSSDAEDNDSCRCSHLCHRTSSRQGCTDEYPENVYEKSDYVSKEGSRRLSSDMKDKISNSSLTGSCRCSHLCYRTKDREGCTSEEQKHGSRRPSGDLKRHESGSGSSCSCVSHRKSKHKECTCRHCASRTTKSCSSMRKSSSSLSSCHCDNYSTYQSNRHPYPTTTPNNPYANIQFTNGCLCYSLTTEVPVKGPRSNAADDCSCSINSAKSDHMSAFSLDSTDAKYLEKVRQLTQQDCDLKQDLDNLTAQEKSLKKAIEQNGGRPSSSPQGTNGNKPASNNARMLRSLNKELQSLHETLCDRIQDLRLERDQLTQKIEGPLNRELDRIRKKYVQVQAEIATKSSPDYVDSSSDELELVKSQLARTQENIGDMALVNDGIKQEVLVLEYKCGQMEQALIQQKMNEIDAINKLQEGSLNCSAQGSSQDTSCSCIRDVA